MLTSVPAAVWDLDHRGVLEPGAFADVVVFDPTIGCAAPTVRNDLPDGGPRLAQSATGIDAILVNGHLTTTEGHPTGATPGTLLRSPPHPP